MKTADAKSRILAAVITVLMAVMVFTAARADDGLEITVWYGDGQSAQAVCVGGGTDYWAQLPESAFYSAIGSPVCKILGNLFKHKRNAECNVFHITLLRTPFSIIFT